MTSQTRRAGVVLAGALLAAVLAACGNDVEKKSSPPPTNDGGSPAPTSTAIDTNVQQGAIGQKVDLKNLSPSIPDPVSYTHLTLPTNREV